MIGGSSEKKVKHILNHIDNNIWEAIADKVISKMPRYKLTLQSQKMFNDFTMLTNQISGYTTEPLKEQLELNGQILQNLLVGTSKMEPNNTKTAYPTEKVQKSQKQIKNKKQRLKSAVQFINQETFEPEKKINNLFNLSTAKNQNEQDQKHDSILRTNKYENMRYNQQIQNQKKLLEAESKHRAYTQQKRFKQMKQFTFDYNGQFLVLNSNKNAKIKVINMKHKYGNNIKSNSLGRNILSKDSKASQIQYKKIIRQDRMSTIQLLKQREKEKEKDKDDKLNKYLNSDKPKVNSFELFKDEKAISVGVSIIDLSTSQRFFGKIRDKGNNKNLSLRQYQNQTKYVESIKQRINIKQRKSQRYVTKTQYYESTYDNNRRLNTQGTDKQSKILTSLTRFVKNRGKIIIQDSKLYSQNFTEDFN